MKIRYLQLMGRLNIPGVGAGSSNKLNANGSSEARTGMVRTIEEVPNGYRVEVPAGPHKGHYFVPMHRVEHAGLLPDEPAPMEIKHVYATTKIDAEMLEASKAPEPPKGKRQKHAKPEPDATA